MMLSSVVHYFCPSMLALWTSALPPPRLPSRIRASSSMAGWPAASPVMSYPYLSPAHRDLMVDLLSTIDSRLGSHLLPSSVPPEVLSFRSPNDTSRGALDIRSGRQGSSVDLMVESWLHCEVPTGAVNITTLFAFLNTSTDAPHFLMEFIQSSPASLILFIDLLPRKDLVLHPDYLDEFYQDTRLDEQRQQLAKLAEVVPFCSSSLYIRSLLSPTAVAVNISCGEEGQGAMEKIMATQIDSVAKEIVRIWLDKCASSVKQLEESERAVLLRRDDLIKSKAVELDLAANFPPLFGPDIANQIVGEIQKAFRIQDQP